MRCTAAGSERHTNNHTDHEIAFVVPTLVERMCRVVSFRPVVVSRRSSLLPFLTVEWRRRPPSAPAQSRLLVHCRHRHMRLSHTRPHRTSQRRSIRGQSVRLPVVSPHHHRVSHQSHRSSRWRTSESSSRQSQSPREHTGCDHARYA